MKCCLCNSDVVAHQVGRLALSFFERVVDPRPATAHFEGITYFDSSESQKLSGRVISKALK